MICPAFLNEFYTIVYFYGYNFCCPFASKNSSSGVTVPSKTTREELTFWYSYSGYFSGLICCLECLEPGKLLSSNSILLYCSLATISTWGIVCRERASDDASTNFSSKDFYV
jgi:hypothetical protein